VRGPFVIEGAITGALAGLLAGLVTFGLTLAAISSASNAFARFAPGVTLPVAGIAAALVLLVGLALGSGSSLISLRRHMET
jgi:cell division protein FtsX